MRAALAGAALIALAGCARPPVHEPVHRHPTVVSLNPCSDAALFALADPTQILALSAYSRDPASSSMDTAVARRFEAVSGSAEEVLALAPDLVLADSFLAPATAAALRRAGVRLIQLPIATSVADSEAQVRAIARLVGQPARGEALVARIETALDRAAPPSDARPIPTVVWQSGGLVPGEATLIAELLRRTGFVNFAALRGMRQADYLPLETLIADPPALILTAGDAHAQEDRLLGHPALAALAGTRRERLDPKLLWCGGPTIIGAAERLATVRRKMRRSGPAA